MNAPSAWSLATGNVWQALQSRIVPYVVEVQKEGAVRAVGPALQHYIPQDANIAWYLGEFIKHVRALPIDPVVVRDNWRSAYAFSTDHTKALLSAYARENDPRKLIGHRAVDVQVTSVVRASDTSFEVKWTEQVMDQDQPAKVQHWTAILTYLIQPPGDETTLRINPLGIYVNGINWSREITADPAP